MTTINRMLAERFHCCRRVPTARPELRLCFLRPGHAGACLPVPDRTLELAA